ncbi:hypothetical protein [Anaerococcus prevotii]|uniref:Uncharacterized protein n=1 Tax=Anaerococcus prevotii ACS-065-V-Col13 TaxID=879305 RepID=F0GVJ0_9FIRM|nr:hypothetical protein [Anaerococcus prevotii]EGC82209.1 hypothetical protein HMPREF9290_0823 [Anaerococcus prevotii ACS-065-V-Col13]
MTNKKILACLLAVNFSLLGLSETSPLVNISYAEEEVKENVETNKEDSKEETKENTTEEKSDNKEEVKEDTKEEKSDKKDDTKENLEKEDEENKTEENVESTQNLAVAYYADENLDDLVYGGEVSLYSLDDGLEVSEAPRPRMARAARSATSDLKTQKNQLQKAIDDSVNVKSTEVYNSLVTQKLRNEYNQAVANAREVLANNGSDYEKLRLATVAINRAKENLATYASLKLQINTLEESLEESEIRAEAARILVNKFPKLVESVKGDLLKIIDEADASAANSRALIEEASSYLNNL